MKKIILLCVASLSFYGMNTVNAQTFYAEVSSGYGVGLKESNLGVEQYTDLENGGKDSYIKNIYGTLGSGLNVTVTPGYMFTPNIGLELGVNFFKGNKTLMEYKHTTNKEVNGYGKTVAYSNQLRILPSVVIHTGGDKIFGYAKAGLVLPVSGSTIGTVDAYTNTVLPGGNMRKIDITTVTNGNFSLGFRGTLGVGYQITDFMSINLEVFHTSLSIKSKNREYTQFIVDEVEFLEGNVAPYTVSFIYSDELNSESNTNVGLNNAVDYMKPKDELASKTNFSQFGGQLTLRFNIFSKGDK